MLARSGGWFSAGTVEDKGGNNGAGDTALLPRLNSGAKATARAMVAMPSAAHGAMVCALQGAGATAAVSDVPHS